MESLLNISPKIGIEIKKKGKILYSPIKQVRWARGGGERGKSPRRGEQEPRTVEGAPGLER